MSVGNRQSLKERRRKTVSSPSSPLAGLIMPRPNPATPAFRNECGGTQEEAQERKRLEGFILPTHKCTLNNMCEHHERTLTLVNTHTHSCTHRGKGALDRLLFPHSLSHTHSSSRFRSWHPPFFSKPSI